MLCYQTVRDKTVQIDTFEMKLQNILIINH